MDYSLPWHELETLREEHKREKSKKQADRIKSVYLLGSGWSVKQVCEALLLDDETIRRHYKAYKEGGLKNLKPKHKGSQSFITPDQINILKKELSSNLYTDAREVQEFICQEFNIFYALRTVTEYLNKLGFSYKKTRIFPGELLDKNKEINQREHVRKHEKILENSNLNNPVFHMDATHPTHNTMTGKSWVLRGEDFFIPSNSGRQRLNIHGAVNLNSHEVVYQFPEKINAETTVEFLKKVENQYPDAESIKIFCDNAAYYKSKLVKAFLCTSKIQLFFLPPYSPNLNLIERLWKFFKKKALANKYYKKYDDFKIACGNFFEKINIYKEELKTLLTPNFEIFC